MPEISAIFQSQDVDSATNLLTEGLNRILDDMAPIRKIQSRQNYAPKWVRRQRASENWGTYPRNRQLDLDWRIYNSLINQAHASFRRHLVAHRRQKMCSEETPYVGEGRITIPNFLLGQDVNETCGHQAPSTATSSIWSRISSRLYQMLMSTQCTIVIGVHPP